MLLTEEHEGKGKRGLDLLPTHLFPAGDEEGEEDAEEEEGAATGGSGSAGDTTVGSADHAIACARFWDSCLRPLWQRLQAEEELELARQQETEQREAASPRAGGSGGWAACWVVWKPPCVVELQGFKGSGRSVSSILWQLAGTPINQPW